MQIRSVENDRTEIEKVPKKAEWNELRTRRAALGKKKGAICDAITAGGMKVKILSIGISVMQEICWKFKLTIERFFIILLLS
jgi:hypothetical protein